MFGFVWSAFEERRDEVHAGRSCRHAAIGFPSMKIAFNRFPICAATSTSARVESYATWNVPSDTHAQQRDVNCCLWQVAVLIPRLCRFIDMRSTFLGLPFDFSLSRPRSPRIRRYVARATSYACFASTRSAGRIARFCETSIDRRLQAPSAERFEAGIGLPSTITNTGFVCDVG